MGPVREIDTTTFDEHSARHRQHLTAEPTVAGSRAEMVNGATGEGLSPSVLHMLLCHVPKTRN